MWSLDLVVTPFCDCRLCCRDEMEIKKTAHAGRLFFCPSAVGGGAYIFASSESHRNAHRTPPPLRPYHYTTEPTNATQRATENHRERPNKRPKHSPLLNRPHGTGSTHAGRQRGRKRPLPTQSRKRSKFQNLRSKFHPSKFGSMSVKISPVKFSKFAVKI